MDVHGASRCCHAAPRGRFEFPAAKRQLNKPLPAMSVMKLGPIMPDSRQASTRPNTSRQKSVRTPDRSFGDTRPRPDTGPPPQLPEKSPRRSVPRSTTVDKRIVGLAQRPLHFLRYRFDVLGRPKRFITVSFQWPARM